MAYNKSVGFGFGAPGKGSARTGYSSSGNSALGLDLSGWSDNGNGTFGLRGGDIATFDDSGAFKITNKQGVATGNSTYFSFLQNKSEFSGEIAKMFSAFKGRGKASESVSADELSRRSYFKEQRAQALKSKSTSGDLFANSILNNSSTLLG